MFQPSASSSGEARVGASLLAYLHRHDAARGDLPFAERGGDGVGPAPLPLVEGVFVHLQEPMDHPLGIAGCAALTPAPLLQLAEDGGGPPPPYAAYIGEIEAVVEAGCL